MDIGIVALVFGVIFIAELPDKSLFASLILGSRFPGWYVWLGAASAFLIHVIIAVTAGKLLTLLPHRLLEGIIAALFLGGALLLFSGKQSLENNHGHKPKLESGSFWKIYATSFSVVFIGEWGDITQITTINYVAKYHDPWSVGIGALLGLWTAAAVAIIAGTKALTVLPPRLLQRITATILLLFGIFSIVSALK